MNQDIAKQKALKKKLGVTITKNMGVKDVLEAWGRVSPAIKSTLPGPVAAAMTSAEALITTGESLRGAYTVALGTYEALQLTIETASGAMTGNPNTLVLQASNMAQQAEAVVDEQVNDLGPTLVTNLTALVG